MDVVQCCNVIYDVIMARLVTYGLQMTSCVQIYFIQLCIYILIKNKLINKRTLVVVFHVRNHSNFETNCRKTEHTNKGTINKFSILLTYMSFPCSVCVTIWP